MTSSLLVAACGSEATGGATGIGFATSSNTAVNAATQLIANGQVVTPPSSALTVTK